ncbi:MAG: SDR family NAD(P)-dependent oxidoreductase, partial [Polyangiaceae bacterium]|nr:SDR family NAD(P)-dependent oxidoreductase [Polyangiaceae bacterium]
MGTIRRDEGSLGRLLLSLAELHVRGLPVAWTRVLPPGRRVDLPTYPFQRERYWLDLSGTPGARREAVAFESWRYRIAWEAATWSPAPPDAGWWLVAAPEEPAPGAAEALARTLAAGARVKVLRLPAARQGRGAVADSLRELLAAEPAPRGVLSLLALDETPMEPGGLAPSGLARTLALVQALGDTGTAAPLWLLTCGAVSVGPDDALTSPVQAMTWGLGRVVALEHPDRWGGLVDVDALGAVSGLFAILAGSGREDQVAVRGHDVFVRRLVRAERREPPTTWKPAGTVLVTGGTGAVGAHVARWLARGGAGHLVLASRRGHEAPGAEALATELRALGARVTLAACDVADRGAVESLVRALRADPGSLRSVFHAAGIMEQTAIASMTPADLARGFDGKARGARILHEVIGGEIDDFVLFSSGAGVWGGGGQAAYAAASAFLDALAEHRRARGWPATAIAWGLWAGEGMGAKLQEGLRRRGIAPMDPDSALLALHHELAGRAPTAIVADVDWARFAPAFASARSRPLLESLDTEGEAAAGTNVDGARGEGRRRRPGAPNVDVSWLSDLRARPVGERLEHVLARVRAEAAIVLGHGDPSRVDRRTGFADHGFDSLMSLELRKRLQEVAQARLPTTLVFDHPTPEKLAAFLVDRLCPDPGAGQGARGDGATARSEHAASGTDEPVAIVGVGLRVPGGVVDRTSLWRHLASGEDSVRAIPGARWRVDDFHDPDPDARGKSYVRHASLLDDVDRFDAGFFGISPREARHLDPQQRLLLEAAWHCLEDAGIDPRSLADSPTGVFVGVGPSEYARRQEVIADAHTLTGNHTSFTSGRLAFSLGLRGPAMAVDTACSSSLVALHLACRSLRRGECALALAAGVQLMVSPSTFVLLSRTRALAPDGRTKTFSSLADGYGRGEGVVVLALERLSDAQAKGRRVLGVVRGTAVSHDGASSGLTVPNGPAQEQAMRAALADAGLSPAEVDVVECHGTGTSLGDPIEVHALAAVYGRDRDPGRPLLIGALKTNIGHLEAASGLAGVAKILAAFAHEALPATLHTTPRNAHIDWDSLPVRVVDTLHPWPAREGRLRRAGVTAIGLSGTNAHVILEEAPRRDEAREAAAYGGPVALLLSAKTEGALAAQARELAGYLEAGPEVRLEDVAASL